MSNPVGRPRPNVEFELLTGLQAAGRGDLAQELDQNGRIEPIHEEDAQAIIDAIPARGQAARRLRSLIHLALICGLSTQEIEDVT